MKNADTPAIPTKGVIDRVSGQVWCYQVGDNDEFQFVGLTKRERFAMAAMQGILSNSGGVIQSNPMSGTGFCNSDPEDLAKLSIACADALLAELEVTHG